MKLITNIRPFLLVGLQGFLGKSDVGGKEKKRLLFIFLRNITQCLCRKRNKKNNHHFKVLILLIYFFQTY
jgi:hypothetical protein